LLELPFDKLTDDGLAFAAIDAFCAEVTTSEDLLGWLFVLRDWRPGTPEGCLFALLDKVQVGVGAWSETAAKDLLESLDEDGLRKIMHVPTDQELTANGFEAGLREAVTRSISAHLGGLMRVAQRRLEGGRGYVVSFNKLKHLLLALPTRERGKYEVLVPHWLTKDPTGKPFDIHVDGIYLQDLWIGRPWMASNAWLARRSSARLYSTRSSDSS